MRPDVKYLFFHTAAAGMRNVDAAVIDRWHRGRGWKGIGYHYVIIDDRHDGKPDGLVEQGRPEDRIGAHVLEMNGVSLGVCCVGHGDRSDFTPAQKQSLVRLLARLARRYDVPVKNILGHREVNGLVDRGLAPGSARTSKSCPGRMVSTDEIRRLVAAELAAPAFMAASAPDDVRPRIREAVTFLDAHHAQFGNALDEWRRFAFHAEIRALVEGGNAAAAPAAGTAPVG